MPRRIAKPTFIAEFPLRTNEAHERTLDNRLEAARHIYNAVLGHCLKRLHAMRTDIAWTIALAMPRNDDDQKRARSIAFDTIREKHGLLRSTLQKYAETCRESCWIGHHLGSHDTQAIATRAFLATERYMYRTGGRPRFKTKGAMKSIEGKSNKAVIRYRETPTPAIHYDGLVLPLHLDRKDKKQWQANALGHETRYCRLVRRSIRNRERWYVQLVQRGNAPRLHDTGNGTTSLDIGPSTIATVTQHSAELEQFCPTVEQPWKSIRRTERAMDRSRRATNPERFDNKGRWIKQQKGQPKQRIHKSSRYVKLAAEKSETARRLAAERNRAHGQHQNETLAKGRNVKSEKLSYVSFQKNYGRSTTVRAPGAYMAGLKRKASGAGGQVTGISTWTTRLSQYDHTTGDYAKKKLSERTHLFRDGVTPPVQRDLYSAFLAGCCDADTLDVSQVRASWTAAEPLLRRAMSRYDQRTKERASSPDRAANSRRVRRPSKGSASTRRQLGKSPAAA